MGFVAGLTGKMADLGLYGRHGAELAVEEVNRAGGIGGREVRLLIRDDRQEEGAAREAFREMTEARVEAVVGPMTSAMAMVLAPLAEQARLVLVSPTVTTTALAGRDDHFFRVCATTALNAARMARFLRGRGVRRVTCVLESGNAAYTQGWQRDFQQVFLEEGGVVQEVLAYPSTQNSPLEPLAARALATRPDGVVLITPAVDAAALCRHLRQGGAETIALSEWASTEDLIRLGGRHVEGVFCSQFFDRQSTAPAYLAFRQAYQGRHGSPPGFMAMAGYDAAMTVMKALQIRGRGERLKDTLLRVTTFPGLQSDIRLDRYGDSQRQVFVATVKDGAYVSLP
jgi:branched-chain amino acid transport system substrate-binding protein